MESTGKQQLEQGRRATTFQCKIALEKGGKRFSQGFRVPGNTT